MSYFGNLNTGGTKISKGTTGERVSSESLIRINSDTNLLEWYSGGSWHTASSSSVKKSLYFSMTANINSTNGYLTKASDAGLTANPSGKPTTYQFDPGINNAANDPYLITNASTAILMRIKFAGASVSTGTVSSPFMRFRIYRVDYSTRTQLGSDIDITVVDAGGGPTIGTFNNTANDGFQTAVSSALSIAISAGDLIGIEWIAGTGNSHCSGVRNLFVTLDIQE